MKEGGVHTTPVAQRELQKGRGFFESQYVTHREACILLTSLPVFWLKYRACGPMRNQTPPGDCKANVEHLALHRTSPNLTRVRNELMEVIKLKHNDHKKTVKRCLKAQ